MLKAVTRQAGAVDARIQALNDDIRARQRQQQQQEQEQLVTTATFFDRHATPEDMAVLVTEQDFVAAQQELVPSVSAGELAHYERVRAAFEGGGRGRNGADGGLPRRAGEPRRAALDAAAAVDDGGLRTSVKGKGRAVVVAPLRSRKGKEVAVNGWDGDEGDGGAGDDSFEAADEDDMSRRRKAKGKGKAVAASSFHDGASDDDGLYES
jgi:peroxin-6